ncbi:hypothetical protein DID80_02590 [Candidatus Marinamargulisbacteria bacterium SCGC AAA071-K20]|nr:hypothetical protein DID80_02590 [Candidatus Marinamargulisbacteria bacterium SCGC AAA071-K20]
MYPIGLKIFLNKNQWIDPTLNNQQEIDVLISEPEGNKMCIHKVSREVNKPSFKDISAVLEV